jgi:Mce-associated membrane protein
VSPRRRVEADEAEYFAPAAPPRPPRQPRRWGFIVATSVLSVLLAGAIAVSTLMLVSHERDRRTQLRDAAALDYVRGFMTAYTTLDPFNANAYADRIKAQGTGNFEKMFSDKMNEILIQVARSEPTTGTVLEAGVQRWNDNGSADVLVATKITTTSPDGKSTIESGSRWVATAAQEGNQWKISNLIQVI